LVTKTDKAGQPSASTSTCTAADTQSSARPLQTNYGASARALSGHNILPNPPKLPSQVPTFNPTTTNFNDAFK
jgi:hypothetical protein